MMTMKPGTQIYLRPDTLRSSTGRPDNQMASGTSVQLLTND